MNTAQAPAWLPPQLVPFFTLSYPTAPPAIPDSFPDANYYGTGLLDGCLVITAIAVMAVLRDATRLVVCEPFARWKLARDLRNEKRRALAKANGTANGTTKAHANGNGTTNGHAKASPDVFTPAERRKMHRSVIRFAEQGWSVVYYTLQWGFGLVRPLSPSPSPRSLDRLLRAGPHPRGNSTIMKNHETNATCAPRPAAFCVLQYVHSQLPTTVFHPINVWAGYPHVPLAGPVKFYYLLQIAFYLHQILVINAEARRKDHWQMLSHHLITVPLMVASYFYNYTRVGCLIMVLMDCSDIFLPVRGLLRSDVSSDAEVGSCAAGEDAPLPRHDDALRLDICSVHVLMARHAPYPLHSGHHGHLQGLLHCPPRMGPLTGSLYDQGGLCLFLHDALCAAGT